MALWNGVGANGRMGTAAMITRTLTQKRSVSRMNFHPEHYFEGFHLQMPSPRGLLTGSQGRWISRARLENLESAIALVRLLLVMIAFGVSYASRSRGLFPFRTSNSFVLIGIVRETTATQLTCAEMCECTYLRPPFPWGLGQYAAAATTRSLHMATAIRDAPGPVGWGVVRADP